MQLICSKCHKKYSEQNLRWQCSCGGYLECEFTTTFTRQDIKSERHNMWRYDSGYPIKYEDLTATYNEGLTPLITVPKAGCKLRAKMDSLMPTGSFKDRGTVMVVNFLKKQGVKKITEDSSGNAGASVAAYCALADIPCEIYVPRGNSIGKLIQIQAYGASIHEVSGTREDVAAAAQKDTASYAGHNWHPMFIQGTKSLAYELWEQNNFESPENIVAVAGNGSTILGIYYGFKELLSNHQVTKMPHLFVVQSENCNPIHHEYVGSTPTVPFTRTIAEGIALSHPNKSRSVVAAVKECHGQVVSVSDDDIITALKLLCSRGLYLEPTSAAAYAGITQLLQNDILSSTDDVIMVVSGNGLKAGAEIQKLYELKY